MLKYKKSLFGFLIGTPTFLISSGVNQALETWDWYNEGINWLWFNLALIAVGILLFVLVRYIIYRIKLKHRVKVEFKTNQKLEKQVKMLEIKKELKDNDVRGKN